MLEELQETRKLTYLFIAHDLAIVKHISTRIGVMYLGHMVELAESAELYRNPIHPYTEMLLSAIPIGGSGSFRGKKTDQAGGRGAKPLKSSVRLSFPDPVSESQKSLCGSMPALRGDHPGPFRRLP